ncbi:major capsid protein [Streptomyces sp. NBC_01565]|uniref:major capsid protein n=1 Tax=Streptomyces sp. NBC_01565 TaxID=2975881 RepID=UPI0022502DFB|nr:phage major capsid protein [Streptomyces sp. NBC_01565]MCX4540492.1 phage major capsid protein [Streptomyces sp. NBC_01565]
MPVTLAQAQLNTQNDIDFAVIDNLRRYSWLLDRIVFDDTVTPGTGGGSLTYGYTRLKTPRTAAFRALNSEYSPAEAQRERITVDLKPHGGAFSVDRVLSNLGASATNETTFQMQQLLTAVQQRWQEELINGDVAVDALGFDGLNKSLTGTATEYDPLDNGTTAGYLDWRAATVITQPLAMAALDQMDEFLSQLMPSKTGGGDQGSPGALPPGEKAILGNTKSITRIRALARWAGLYTADKDEVGRRVERYADWALVDIGNGQTGASPIIPVYSADADEAGGGGTITGLTDIYAVTFGMDALHGASVAGNPLVQTWLPDFAHAGAVKTGEIEMGPTAMVLKNTKSCGVLRKVKVQ